jgi:hypothetical protein
MSTMSTSAAASEWDLTVPVDDAELLAEFRHHGVRPGQRVHVGIVTDEAVPDQVLDSPLSSPASRGHQIWRNNLGRFSGRSWLHEPAGRAAS